MRLRRLAKKHNRYKPEGYFKLFTIFVIVFISILIFSGIALSSIAKSPQENLYSTSFEGEQLFTSESQAADILLPEELHGPYAVTRVIDGDTLMVSIDCLDVRVRLIGIDTPESVNPDTNKNVPFGKIASNFTKELLDNKEVYLEYDSEKLDKFDRTLAYVYLPNGTMINKLLAQDGYALALSIKPNIKYAKEIKSLVKDAKDEQIGLWSDEAQATAPDTLRR